MSKKGLLLLGYGHNETDLHRDFERLGWHVTHSRKVPDLQAGAKFDLVVCYGLRQKLTIEEITRFRPINLHISYLPFNRGAHPNFWSHFEDTPVGVTIHKIDEGLDTGDILVQEHVELNKEKLSFQLSYTLLRAEVERLLRNNIDAITEGAIAAKPQIGAGTFHRKDQLPADFRGWHCLIGPEIRRLRDLNNGVNP